VSQPVRNETFLDLFALDGGPQRCWESRHRVTACPAADGPMADMEPPEIALVELQRLGRERELRVAASVH